MALRAHTVTSAPPNLTNLTFHSRQFRRPATLRFRNSCSTRTNSLTAEQVSFTEEENSLVEALIGIQGRGRSASPQQLNVVTKTPSWRWHFLFYSLSWTKDLNFLMQEVESAVQVLEALQGVPDPVRLPWFFYLFIIIHFGLNFSTLFMCFYI